jgi:outer membrane protein TolC
VLALWLAAAVPAAARSAEPSHDRERDPFAGAAELERGAVIAAALARNPSLLAARFAVDAATAREPGERAFDAPMLEGGVAPAAFGSENVDGGWRVGAKQSLRALGRAGLRGDKAAASTRTRESELAGAGAELAARASQLFDAVMLSARERELFGAQLGLLEALRATATSRYAAGEGSAQEPLRAELELAIAREEESGLRAREEIARARLNALLHRSPGATLPALPRNFEASPDLGASAEALEAELLASRPELRAARARVDAAAAEARLAARDLWPDLTLTGSYDRIWQERELRGFVGAELELPLRARSSTAAAARAELEGARAELAAAEDAARLALHVASARLRASDERLRIAESLRAPAARDRAEAARAAYAAGRGELSDLLEALRDRIDAEREIERARSEQSSRRSELSALLGRIAGSGAAASGVVR